MQVGCLCCVACDPLCSSRWTCLCAHGIPCDACKLKREASLCTLSASAAFVLMFAEMLWNLSPVLPSAVGLRIWV